MIIIKKKTDSLLDMTYLSASNPAPPTRAASGTGQARHRESRESVQKEKKKKYELRLSIRHPNDWVKYGYMGNHHPM